MRAAALLSLLAAGCPPSRECGVVLWYVDDGAAADVRVEGDWNGWEPEPLDRVEAGAWSLPLDLAPGDHEYLLIVDGEREIDRLQPLLSWDGAEERSLLRVGDCALPEVEVVEAEADPDGGLRVEARFFRAESGARLGEVEATLDGEQVEASVHPATGEILVNGGGLGDGKHTLVLQARDRDGVPAETVRLPLWVEPEPFRWEDALVYQVVVDRFAGPAGPLPYDPDAIGDRAGGTLAGLARAIESGWFESLGVNTLWISPLYDNPEGRWEGRDGRLSEAYHGYWPTSPDAVEPAFGTTGEVESLVALAHGRGMRVLMDVVPNHVHADHPYWTEHRHDGWFHEDPDCICGDYDCPWSDDIETCWFTEFLPDVAFEDPDATARVVADTVAWATRFDLDGFRVDAVPMMPRAAVRELVWALDRAVGRGPTRFYTVGETFTGSSGHDEIRANLGPFGLDGQFDFPVLWALRDFAAAAEGGAPALAVALDESEAAWEGSGSVMAPFVGNHDLPRFVSVAAGDGFADPWDDPPPQPTDSLPYRKLLVAQAVALTLPGAPVLYYGDEIGLAGANDPDSRRPMVFEGDLSPEQTWTLERTRRIGTARAACPALRRGARRELFAEGTVYAHLRDAADGAPALTLVNASDRDQIATIAIPPDVVLAEGTPFVDVVEGASAPWFTPGEPVSLTLPAWTARLYVPRGPCAGGDPS